MKYILLLYCILYCNYLCYGEELILDIEDGNNGSILKVKEEAHENFINMRYTPSGDDKIIKIIEGGVVIWKCFQLTPIEVTSTLDKITRVPHLLHLLFKNNSSKYYSIYYVYKYNEWFIVTKDEYDNTYKQLEKGSVDKDDDDDTILLTVNCNLRHSSEFLEITRTENGNRVDWIHLSKRGVKIIKVVDSDILIWGKGDKIATRIIFSYDKLKDEPILTKIKLKGNVFGKPHLYYIKSNGKWIQITRDNYKLCNESLKQGSYDDINFVIDSINVIIDLNKRIPSKSYIININYIKNYIIYNYEIIPNYKIASIIEHNNNVINIDEGDNVTHIIYYFSLRRRNSVWVTINTTKVGYRYFQKNDNGQWIESNSIQYDEFKSSIK